MTSPIKLPPLTDPIAYAIAASNTGLWVKAILSIDAGHEGVELMDQKYVGRLITTEQAEAYARAAIEADRQQSDTRTSRSVEQLKEALLNRNHRFVATHSEVKNLIEYYEADRQTQDTIYTNQYLSLTDAMGYESDSGLSPEEWAANLLADRKTIEKQLSAYRIFVGSLEMRLAQLQEQHDELKKRTNPDLLTSERAANAMLTEELEAERKRTADLISGYQGKVRAMESPEVRALQDALADIAAYYPNSWAADRANAALTGTEEQK